MDHAQINSAVVAEYRAAIEADRKYIEVLTLPAGRRALSASERQSLDLRGMRIARCEAAIAMLQREES